MRSKILLISALLCCAGMAQAQPLCLMNTHRYYQPVTISNSNAGLSNFQVKITVNTATLVSAGKLAANGSDLRFYTLNCTYVPYFIESGMNTSATVIWLNIPSLPNGNSTIYMYYGATIGAASDPFTVFDFYDDFSGSVLNSSKWTTAISGGSYSMSGGILNLSTSSYFNVLSTSTYSAPMTAEMYATATSGNWPHIGQFTSASTGDGVNICTSGNTIVYPGYMPNLGANYYSNFYTSYTAGSLIGIWSFSWPATNSMIFSWPGGSGSWGTTTTRPGSIRGVFGLLNGGSGSMSVDWYRMRKYAASVPSASFAAEELNLNLDVITLYRSAGPVTEYCGLDLHGYDANILGLFNGGSLYIEISNASGSFASPTIINGYGLGTGYFGYAPYYFGTSFSMINSLPYGTGYRIRLRSTSPAYNGKPSNAFTLGAKPTSVNFTINNAAQCNETDAFVFTGTAVIASGNTRNLDWNLGDSTTSNSSPVSKSYAYYGNKNVKMVAYNASMSSCRDSVTKTVVVHPQPVAVLDHQDNCKNDEAFFSSWSSYVAVGWVDQSYYDFGDGNNYTQSGTGYTFHTYSNFGSFNATLIVTSDKGCKDTHSLTHKVFPQPVVTFTNDLACDGHEVVFKNNSTVNTSGGSNMTAGSNYWNMGDGGQNNDKNPRYQYAGPGNYYVRLVAYSNRGCYDTFGKYVTVYPSPNAEFTLKNTCLSDQLILTNTSSISSGTMTYKWNLGNGTTSTSQHHSLYYNQPGNYNIKLNVTAGTGCTDSTNHDALIFPMPIPQFTATSVCQGWPMEFSNLTAGATLRVWTFEPGQTSTAENPTYTYSSAGTRLVKLSVTSPNACVAEISKFVNVWDNPVASFTSNTPTNCLNGNKFTFTNTSSIGSGILGYEWRFGDNTMSNAQHPVKTYDKPGTYSVTLAVESDKHCIANAVASVAVNPHPVSDFSFNNSCTGDPVLFSNKSTISGGVIQQTFWQTSNGFTSALSSPTFTFTSAGDYIATLTSTSDKGCTTQISKTYTAWPIPSIDFSSGDACFGLANPFTNASSVSSGFMASYDWDFGDGAHSAEINPSHTYAAAGSHTVGLTGKTDKGCMETYMSNVSVWPQPKADFTMNNVCIGLPTNFNNTSSISGGTMSNNWAFGDGQTATVNSPSHTYTSFGNFLVTLKVNSDKNCEASISKEAKVYKQPVAAIGASRYKTTVLDPEITFYDNSQYGDLRQWTFSGGSNGSSILPTESISFNIPGKFPIILVSTSSDGCSDTANATVEIDNAFSIYFPTAFTPNGDKLNEEFGAVGIFSGIKNYTLSVLDNKGRVVFSTQDINKRWNGKLENSGDMLAAGPYAWFAEYTDYKNIPHKVNGIISIRR